MAEPGDKKVWTDAKPRTDTKPWAKKTGKPDFKKDGNRGGADRPTGNNFKKRPE
jgi:hypothetical protein